MSSTKRPTRDDMSRFAWTTAAFLASAAFCGSVAAQAYPSRPVKLIAPYAPGGPLDEVARVVSPRLTESLGQPVVVENRAGAGGDIGTDFDAKSAPDGYTVLLGNGGPITINPALKGKLPYDPQKDLAPVTLAVSSPMVMVVHPSLPVKTVKELVARLNGEIARILQRQDVKERFASRGADVIASTPEELGSFIKKEGALYAKVIKDLGIRPE